MKTLVDTNVILDILCKREEFFEDSFLALNKCLDNGTVLLSASSMTDIFYIAKKYIGDNQAKKQLNNLFDIVTISDTKSTDIKKAFDSLINDFEDALVSEVAKREKAKYILTRNTKDFKNSQVKSISPKDYLLLD